MLDMEGGASAIRSKANAITAEDLGKKGFKPSPKDVDVLRVKTWDEFDGLVVTLEEGAWYKTVVVDSLTEVNYLCLNQIVEAAAAKSSSRDPDSIELQDYQKLSTRMRRTIRAFRDLEAHVVLVAGVNEREHTQTKLQWRVPDLTGRLVWELPGLIDILGLLETEETPVPADEDTEAAENGEVRIDRVLYTYPSTDWLAKDRSEGGMLGGVVENPTLPILLDLLEI